MADEAVPAPEVVTPIIIDLGKKRGKRIRDLKKGRGRLMAEVAEVVQEVYESLEPAEAEGKQLVPIVMIYRQRKKKNKYGLFPFLG